MESEMMPFCQKKYLKFPMNPDLIYQVTVFQELEPGSSWAKTKTDQRGYREGKKGIGTRHTWPIKTSRCGGALLVEGKG